VRSILCNTLYFDARVWVGGGEGGREREREKQCVVFPKVSTYMYVKR